MADENPYMPLVEKDAEQGVRASMLTAVEKQPDTEAKLQDLARRYNMPVEAVRLNQPEVQRRAAFEAVDYETLAREMPSTAAWLSSPENAAIAHDNVDSMGAIERKLRQFVGGAVESVGMSAAGVGQLGDIGQRMLANDFAAIFLPEPQRGPMGLEPQKPTIESLAGPLIGEGLRQAGGAVKDYARSDIGGVGEKTFADQVFGGIGQVAGQALLLPVLRGGGLYAQGAESMAEKVAGDKADQRTKDLAVLGGAAVTGATEAWALDKLLGPLAVPVKNQIGAALARIGIGAAAEGGQEISENLLQDIIRKALTNNDAEIDVGQSVEEGGVGAAVGGVVRTVIESALHIKARGDSRAQQAEQGAQAIAELSDLAKKDKLLQRNPQAFEQFVKQAAEGGPVTTVYIDAQTLMQSGVVRELADVSPSVAEQIETAVATGGQVAIPVEEFAARIAPTDLAQSLIDHIRTEPDGFTRAEAQEYMQSQADQLQQEVERTLSEKDGDATFQQSQEVVKTRIQDELNALGRFTPEKNAADAVLFASYYATRAAQLGVTPEALYDQRRVRFAAEAVAGQQFQQTGTVEGMPDNQAPGPQGDAQQGANKGNAVSKHSPEQLAKWAAEKRARESRQAAQAEADRQLERRLSQNSIERMRKSPMWGAFTQEERSEIEGYSNSRDRAEEGRMATVSAIGRALSDAGLTIEKVSESNDGKSKSIYVRAGDQVVRISDHELPMTAKRQNDRERGLSGRWDREVIVFDWTDSTMADYMVEVLGVAEAGRLGYEIGSRQQGENTSDGDGRSVSQTDQSAPDTDGAFDKNILNQSAFHGTPHRGITKFSTDKIGTGEGAQAYGWGLYFASKREIAEYYREALAPGDTAYSVDGEVAFSGAPNQADPREVAVYAIANGADPATLADKYEDQGVSEDFVTGVRAAVAALDGKKVERVESKEGQLYEVDIPEDSEMLLWDKPLSEQPEAVRKVLEKLRADGWRFSDSLRGDAFYQYVARTAYPVKGDKAASESLAALGIKGIKYLDGTSRADGDGSYNYVVFSGDDVTIKNQFYQQARGAFSPESFTITLLKGADLSTALHEGAHFFFENDIALASEIVAENAAFGPQGMTEGQRQIVADVSKLLKWHGITGTIEEQLATWYGMDFEAKRVAHERTAESFEKYLFEGKAPSLELAPYFQKFRAWMLSVYKSLKAFLGQNPEAGKLDDTVRQVFDRMLATSEQIKLAEKGRSMFPLFSTAEEAGMSVEEFAAYQAQAAQPTADAIEDLQARGLRDLQWLRNATGKELKRLQKQAAVLRAEARIDARREVMSQPVYRAWQFLTGRMSKDDKAALKQEQVKATTGLNVERDSLFVAIAKLGGLDRDAVQKAWGWDPAERTPQPAFGRPLLRREGGLSIDAMAQLLAENGYLGEVDGTADYLSEFEAKFDAEYRGDAQYSFSHDYARSMERRAGDGVDLDSLNAGRLDAWSLDDMGLPPTIPEFLKGLGMTAKDGLHPDIVADRFGFPSGDEMVRTLAAAQTPKEAIEALTDRLMMERHGELSTPEAIAQAADAAVHNAARARMLATEANALAQASGGRKVLVQAAREFARNVVARVKVGELRPSQYTNAAARAGKLAEQASKAGDVATAAAEKRNQLVQTLAAREAFDAREEVAGLRRAWSSLANRSDEKLKKSYDMDIVNAVRAILANVGVAEHKGKRAAEYLESLRDYDPTTHAVISQSVTAAEAIGKPLNGMTIEEVRGLADEIEALLHLARRSRQMEVDGKLLDREEIEDALQARMVEIGIPSTMPGSSSAITPGEQRLSKFRTLIASARRVESWVNSMDSQDMGPFRRFIFGPVKDAADRYRADKAKYLKQFRDLFDTIAPTLKPQLIAAPELGYTFGKDSGGSAINEIVHAILHTGNESNKRKLLVGRGWAQVLDSGDLDTSRWDAFINRMAAEGKLKKEHFDFAQGVWDLLEQTKPLAQKTHRDVFGKYFDEITAEPVQTPFGVYAGGYVPAMADSRIVTDAKLRKLREDENAGMSYAFPTTPTGFTKARVEYNRPLMLDLRTLAQHIDKVLLFSHMTGPVRDVQKILTDVGTTLDKVSPGSLDGMLTPWLNRSASQQVTSPISADGGTMRFFATMRSRAGMAAMFGNVVNTAQQITGFSIAAVKVKPRLLLSAAVDIAKGPKSFVRAVTEASTYMAGRLDNEVAAMNDQINEILLNPSMLEKGEAWTKKHAYFLQSAMDSWMSPIVWKGAYDQALERGLSHEDAVKLGDSAVRETQGSSLPEDVSRFETGNAFVRLFTQFAGYFNMQANLLGTEFVKVARDMGLRSGAARGLYVFLLGFAAPAIVSELIVQLSRGGPPDEDDDGYLDDWLSALFVWAPMRNATAMVPGVGQGVNAVVNATNGKPYDDRLATSPAISMLETAARAPYSAYRAVVEGGSAQKAVRDVATLISMTVGLPANLAARPVGYLAGVDEGRIEPDGPGDFARGLVTGTDSRP